MVSAIDRLDAAALGENGAETLLRVLGDGAAIVSPSGERFEMPESLVRYLVHAAEAMRQGRSVALVPEKETLTTQEAADHLAVSRPFLIGLLEKGEIPFTMTGTHRRVRFADVMTYRLARDIARRQALDAVFDAIDADGLYFAALDELAGPED